MCDDVMVTIWSIYCRCLRATGCNTSTLAQYTTEDLNIFDFNMTEAEVAAVTAINGTANPSSAESPVTAAAEIGGFRKTPTERLVAAIVGSRPAGGLVEVGIKPADGAQMQSPEQLHLSYAAARSSMHATWAWPGVQPGTFGKPQCWYSVGNNGTMLQAPAVCSTYRDDAAGCRSDHAYGGPCVPWNGSICTALLTNLPASARITYTCGGEQRDRINVAGLTLAVPRTFAARSSADDFSPVAFALFGDQGTTAYNPNGGMEK